MDELTTNVTVPQTYDAAYLWPQNDQSTTAEEVLLRLALRTYPQMNTMGVFIFDETVFLEQLHLDEDAFEKAFEALEKTQRVFKYSRETNEIFVKDYFVTTHRSISKETRDILLDELNEVQSDEIISCFYKNLRDDPKELRGKDALLKAMKKIVKANALN